MNRQQRGELSLSFQPGVAGDSRFFYYGWTEATTSVSTSSGAPP